KLFSLFNSNSKWVTVILPSIILGVFFYLITLNNVYTKTYDIERFSLANETIRSPITIEDEVETERIMRETELAVGERYAIVDDITEEQINYIEEIFEAIDTLTTEEETEESANNEKEEDKGDDAPLSDEELIFQLQEILSSEITDKISDVF